MDKLKGMLKISERDKKLLLIVAAALIVVLAYFFGYQNLSSQADDLSSRKSKLEVTQRDLKEKNNNKVGNKYEVLVEEQIEDNVYVGRTIYDAEEIDAIVYVKSIRNLQVGEFVNVIITDALEYDLMGVIEDEFTE